MKSQNTVSSPTPPPQVAGQGADRVQQVLCDIVRTGVDVHRCQAAQALGAIGNVAAVDDLIAALLDEDEDVRTDAAEALCRLNDSRAASQLMENLLGDPCPEVKLAAMQALAQMDYRELAPRLRRMVKGRDEELAWDENAFYDGGWDDWVDIQVQAVRLLAHMGVSEAVPDIVEAIEDKEGQDLTDVGFKALAGLGDAGVAALAQYLAHPDIRHRRRAAAALSRVEGDTAAAALAPAFEDSASEVRLAAVRGVATCDPTDPRLAARFSDPAADVRVALVSLAGRNFPEQVLALFDDQAGDVQLAVLELLARAPDLLPRETVAEWARSKLTGADGKLIAAAARVLAAVADGTAKDHMIALLADSSRPCEARLGAMSGLAQFGGDDAVQAFVDVLRDGERQVRLESIAALAALAARDPEWPNQPGTVLLAALRGELVPEPEDAGTDGPEGAVESDSAPTPEAERDVAQPDLDDGAAPDEQSNFPTSTIESMLGTSETDGSDVKIPEKGVALRREDIEYLRLAQGGPRKRRVTPVQQISPHQDVPRFAARVLGDVPREDVAEALAPFAVDGDKDTRLAALDSLARIGAVMGTLPGAVVDALLRSAADSDPAIRLYAIRALGRSASQKPVMALIGCLGDGDGFVRAEAIRALAGLGEAGPNAARLLDDPDPAVRLAGAEVVAVVGGPGAIDSLVEFALAFEGYHRREVGRLLRGVDGELASDRLLDVLQDRDRLRLWQPAIEVLEEINRLDTGSDNVFVA